MPNTTTDAPSQAVEPPPEPREISWTTTATKTVDTETGYRLSYEFLFGSVQPFSGDFPSYEGLAEECLYNPVPNPQTDAWLPFLVLVTNETEGFTWDSRLLLQADSRLGELNYVATTAGQCDGFTSIEVFYRSPIDSGEQVVVANGILYLPGFRTPGTPEGRFEALQEKFSLELTADIFPEEITVPVEASDDWESFVGS